MTQEVPIDANIFANVITTKVLTEKEQNDIAAFEQRLMRDNDTVSNHIFELMSLYPVLPNRPNNVIKREDRVKFLKHCLRSWSEPKNSSFLDRFVGLYQDKIPDAMHIKVMLEKDPQLLERWQFDPNIQFANTYFDTTTRQERPIMSESNFYSWWNREIVRLKTYLSSAGYAVGFEYLGEIPEGLKQYGWQPESQVETSIGKALLGKRPFVAMPHRQIQQSYEQQIESQLETLLGDVENVIYTKSGDPKFWNGRIEVKKKIWDAWINPAVSFYRTSMSPNSTPLPKTPMELVQQDIAEKKKHNMIIYENIPLCKIVVKFEKNYDMQQNRINLWLKCSVIGKFDMKQTEHLFFLIGKKRLLAPKDFIENHCTTLKDTKEYQEKVEKILGDYEANKGETWKAYRPLYTEEDYFDMEEEFAFQDNVVAVEVWDEGLGRTVTKYFTQKEIGSKLNEIENLVPKKEETPKPKKKKTLGNVEVENEEGDEDQMEEVGNPEDKKAKMMEIERETMKNFELTGVDSRINDLKRAVKGVTQQIKRRREERNQGLKNAKRIGALMRIDDLDLRGLRANVHYKGLPKNYKAQFANENIREVLAKLKTEIQNKNYKLKSDADEFSKEKKELKRQIDELEQRKKNIEETINKDETTVTKLRTSVKTMENLVPTQETVFYIKIRTFSTNSNKIQFSWGTKYGFWDSVYKLLPKVKMQKNVYQSLETYKQYQDRISTEVEDRLDILANSAVFRITGFAFSADTQTILADWASNIDMVSHKQFSSSNNMYKTLVALKTCQAWFFGKKNDLQETSKQRLVKYLDKDKNDLKKIGHFFGADMDYKQK